MTCILSLVVFLTSSSLLSLLFIWYQAYWQFCCLWYKVAKFMPQAHCTCCLRFLLCLFLVIFTAHFFTFRPLLKCHSVRPYTLKLQYHITHAYFFSVQYFFLVFILTTYNCVFCDHTFSTNPMSSKFLTC
jgi:hypothetical protein